LPAIGCDMEDTIAGLVAAALAVYLLWALIRPEHF
jgi:K+-transporting ATPase KdpF subunit